MTEWDDGFDEEPSEGGGNAPRSRRAVIIAAAAVLVVLLGAVIAYTALDKGPAAASGPTSTAVATTTRPQTSSAGTTAARASGAVTNGAAGNPALSSTAAIPTTAATSPSSTTVPQIETTTAVTTIPPSTTAATTAPVQAVSPTAPAGGQPPTYSTLPDGTPAPVIVVFDTSLITITGAVGDQATKDRVQALALANSKTPAQVDNFLTIDPTVPSSTGVRVVELTSARFDAGSAKVEGAHARELDRITALMNALPNISVLVIGHADQIGTTAANFQLSAERAAAVVGYLVRSGINPARLSSRAVGDADLLTLNSDAASLALNRRTEFIVYGVIGTGS
jgi:OOP family OmpA-OmpF porin